jgi:hypothetical protein
VAVPAFLLNCETLDKKPVAGYLACSGFFRI